MVVIKRIVSFLVVILVGFYIWSNYQTIYTEVKSKFETPTPIINDGNAYTKNKDYLFVKHTDTYIPYNKNDIINIYYSALDQGWTEFTFYCPREYETCINDIESVSKDELLLSNINNYIHPFNSYSEVKTIYDDTGEVTLKFKHMYSQEEIDRINEKLDEMFRSVVYDGMSNEDIILALHDYIVNNTIYDVKRVDYNDQTYDSARMTGLLFQGYGICSAYTDTMAVILFRLGIDNFKISSDYHVWNALYINNNWVHLDVTWDDPVTPSGIHTLTHEYYLINTDKLKSLDKVGQEEHNFNNAYYLYF